jgi:hypothetical protein
MSNAKKKKDLVLPGVETDAAPDLEIGTDDLVDLATHHDGRTMSAIFAKKKLPTITVSICMDTDRADAREQAIADLRVAELAWRKAQEDPDQIKALEEANDVAEAAIDAANAAGEPFTFKALPRKRYSDLIKVHAPTQSQLKEYKAEASTLGTPGTDLPNWNRDSFPPALFHLSAVSPPMSLPDAEELWHGDHFSTGELTALINAAISVNNMLR